MLQSRLCLIAGELLSAPKGWKKSHRTSNSWVVSVFAGNVSYTHCKDHFLPFSLLPTGVFCFPAFQGLGRWEGAEEVSLGASGGGVPGLSCLGHIFSCGPCPVSPRELGCVSGPFREGQVYKRVSSSRCDPPLSFLPSSKI